MTNDPPSQTHSETSVESGRGLARKRLLGQERFVYETLKQERSGKSDWQLWEIVKYNIFYTRVFDQISSLRRARIGLVWQSRTLGATPWHPVEDSGRSNKDPRSNKRTVIWQLKDRYRDMTYEDWTRDFRGLAKGYEDESRE